MNSTKTIGIIGGGQLGQMMAIAAVYRGNRVITLDPVSDCPASFVSEMIVASYDDEVALTELSNRCDVLTYEFENVDANSLNKVVKNEQLPQGVELLKIAQNRVTEKEFLTKKAGVSVVPYQIIKTEKDLNNLNFSKKYVLKTATGGYDGHGQIIISSSSDLNEARKIAKISECVLEEFISFDIEISVIISGNGTDFTVFPVQENIHRNNILSKTIVPARISINLAKEAQKQALRIAKQLKLSGTLCVEMFVSGDEIIVNEIAPRPHNSGHYSIEACNFSQFDTHILGILGQSLPEIKLHQPAIMLNILGQHIEKEQGQRHHYANFKYTTKRQ